MNTNLSPPSLVGESPFRKWLIQCGGIAVGLLNKMVEHLAEIARKSSNTRLYFRGQEIIPIEILSQKFGVTTRTLRRYRSDGKLEYYISKDGRTVFVTQTQFDKYIEDNFICSTDLESNVTDNGENQ